MLLMDGHFYPLKISLHKCKQRAKGERLTKKERQVFAINGAEESMKTVIHRLRTTTTTYILSIGAEEYFWLWSSHSLSICFYFALFVRMDAFPKEEKWVYRH